MESSRRQNGDVCVRMRVRRMHLAAQLLHERPYRAAHVGNRGVYKGSHETLIIAANRPPSRRPAAPFLKLELLLRLTHLWSMLSRPDSTEYADFYKSYIALVPEGSLTNFLGQQAKQYRQLLSGVSDHDASAPTAPGKWSIKQILGHICDT